MSRYHVDDYAKEKIKVLSEKLKSLICIESEKIDFTYIPCGYKTSNIPPAPSDDWKIPCEFERYSGVDKHYWLHMKIPARPSLEDKEYRLCVKTDCGAWATLNPQFTVFVNGTTATQALDTNHHWLPLEADTDYNIYMYLYTGMIGNDFSVDVSLDVIDTVTEAAYYDLRVPYDCLDVIESRDSYIKLRDILDKATLRLDLRDFYSEDYYNGINAMREYLESELYSKDNSIGKTVSCIGHTHIDVAWLWTVAQTREKAQRSFSTFINLMKRYDDFIFMSSQPQLYQHVKENDPELFEKIKQAVRSGKWEPEGAMWLEADTNLISGESLVRQIMYGKRFMKEEFGVDNKILWLPDVFGYSGALPQILKKCGVDKFYTAKISWNQTNDFPHDTFVWEGIDGSQVFAHLMPGYVNVLEPTTVYKFWKSFKDKSYSDTTLLTFGFGDGGGGPTYEMMENYKRLKCGLPGMPKAKIEKAADFFKHQQECFEKASRELANTHKWVGEMYFEMHRGTYTTIAKNKKNNRKSELAHLLAETVSVTDMALLQGVYPEQTLRKNQTNILLNQFHDIIPGSSIKEVYDVTDTEYKRILGDADNIIGSHIANIKNNIDTDGGIFVYNPTPFEVTDFVEYGGKTVLADAVPPHGWRVVAARTAETDVTVDTHSLENSLVKVIFNDKYHIVSVYDKEAGREVLAPDSEANVLEVFEDYPHKYDAWELDPYYAQKRWLADDVSDLTLLSDGIKITRKYGKSLITQNIKLKPFSKRIDFETTVDWNEDHVMLKAAFPLDIRADEASYEIQFGNLKRTTRRNTSWDSAKFEVCAHKWADLSETGYGVSILNDCKYGYSTEDNVMKITLLKAATYPNPVADREVHSFTYSLYPHNGTLTQCDTVKQGYLVNTPLICSEISANKGALADNFCFAKSNRDNVVIETVKKSEEGNDIIIRMYEAYNSKTNVTVTVGFDFKEVYLCNMLEENIKKLEQNGRSVTLPISNFEVHTLKFTV